MLRCGSSLFFHDNIHILEVGNRPSVLFFYFVLKPIFDFGFTFSTISWRIASKIEAN